MNGVSMYRNAMSAGEIVGIFGVSPRAVFQWVMAFVNHEQNGLVAKATSGRPLKLNADKMRRMAFWVREHSPNQLSFEVGLCTLRLIGLLNKHKLKVKLNLPTLGKVIKVIHTLDFSPQRHLHSAWEQGAGSVQALRSEVLEGLLARAKRTGAQLYFADEAGVPNSNKYICKKGGLL